MAFLFAKGKKTPQELVKVMVSALPALADPSSDEKALAKAHEKINTTATAMKAVLYGDAETEARPEKAEELMNALASESVLLELLRQMGRIEFECRKDIAQIWGFGLKNTKVALDFVLEHHEVLEILVTSYDHTPIALNCGAILRECIRHQAVAEILLSTPPNPLFWNFFHYVENEAFDVASDAFSTFKMLLTKHKAVAAKFLEKNFVETFTRYNQLLESENYVTKRQSLKLLGELLLDRPNFKVMMLYINDPANLKIMMNLLRKTTKAIQFEAFHVFKIFVANPKKSRSVVEILFRNREKLEDFLVKFQPAKGPEDEQFAEEKRILLQALAKLDEAALAAAPENP